MTSSTNLLKSSQEVRPFHDWLPPDFSGGGDGRHRTASIHSAASALPVFRPDAPIAAPHDNPAEGDLTAFVAMQAKDMLAAAKHDADAIRQKAREEGLQTGNEEAARIILQAQGILHEVQAWRDETLTGGEAAMMNLVLQIGRKIYGSGFSLEPEYLQTNVAKAIKLAKPLGNLHVHLHPEDVDKLQPIWESIQDQSNLQTLQLVSDETIRRGGCLIEGQSGSVDATIESQLNMVENALDQLPPNQKESD